MKKARTSGCVAIPGQVTPTPTPNPNPNPNPNQVLARTNVSLVSLTRQDFASLLGPLGEVRHIGLQPQAHRVAASVT